jgi:DNA-binding NarL/FixJ family response regulator
MGVQKELDIIIISEKNLRSEGITALIEEGFDQNISVQTISLSGYSEEENDKKPDVCIVDLMSSNSSMNSAFSQLNRVIPDAKFIALHIYKAPELVRPIYNLGAKGYLYYEPSREELVQAIKQVANGDSYYPPFFKLDKNT